MAGSPTGSSRPPASGWTTSMTCSRITQFRRDDLTAVALACIAEGKKIDGDLVSALGLYHRAIEKVGGIRVAPLANAPLTLYLLGHYGEAVEMAREAVQQIRGLNHTSAM